MVELHPDGSHLMISTTVFLVLDFLIVCLRLVAKLKTTRGFAADDVWMLGALAVLIAWTAIIMESIVSVAGTYNFMIIPIPFTIKLLKLFFASELLVFWGFTLVKVSILSYYGSIFDSSNSFRIARRILLGIVSAWCIAVTCTVIFQCRPIGYAWNPYRKNSPKCLPFGRYLFANGLSNVIFDVIILCLPIHMVIGLQLPARQKLTVGGIFLLGGFVCFAGIVRLVYSFDPADPNLVPSYELSVMWTNIELGTAIICGCLPTFGPFFQRFFKKVKPRQWYSSTAHRSAKRREYSDSKCSQKLGDVPDRKLPFRDVYRDSWDGRGYASDDFHPDKAYFQEVKGGKGSIETRGEDLPLHSITVQRQIEILA